MHIQIICCQDFLAHMKYIPETYLLIDGEEQAVKCSELISAICGDLDDIDTDAEGYVRNHALEVLNTMLDPGHENYDPFFYEEIAELVAKLVTTP